MLGTTISIPQNWNTNKFIAKKKNENTAIGVQENRYSQIVCLTARIEPTPLASNLELAHNATEDTKSSVYVV